MAGFRPARGVSEGRALAGKAQERKACRGINFVPAMSGIPVADIDHQIVFRAIRRLCRSGHLKGLKPERRKAPDISGAFDLIVRI